MLHDQDDAAVFMCTFEANPTPSEYAWEFTDNAGDTTEVVTNASDKYVIQSSSDGNSTLTITSTVYDDRGVYTCSATYTVNDVEYTDSASANLTVYGKCIIYFVYIIM